MSDSTPLPDSFPPMGAQFEKPYMEFEYNGQMYTLSELKGGHNGRSAVVKACETKGAHWDEERQKWVVPVENNMIEIDLSEQPEASAEIPEKDAFLRNMKIRNSERRSKKSSGTLLASGNLESGPQYPVDCAFHMVVRVKAPGKPALINPVPFKLEAKGLHEWPPSVGTVYTHDDTVELFPEWLPFAKHFMRPIARIMPGDETILTEVFEQDTGTAAQDGLLKRMVNWLT